MARGAFHAAVREAESRLRELGVGGAVRPLDTIECMCYEWREAVGIP